MADTSLFTRLQRLFSTDVIVRNQGGNQLKVMDVDSIQQSGDIATNSLMDRYNRLYSPSASSLLGSQININWQYLRTMVYSDYDNMDYDAIVASALDIVADECTLKNDMGEVLRIKSNNEDIQQILYNLFYDVLNIEFNLWSWIRQMCKYGDFFLKMEIAEKYGVYNVIPYTAYHIERQENYDKDHPASIRFRYSPEGIYAGGSGYYGTPTLGTFNDNQPGIYFDNYEMAHFRLLTDVNYLPYGRSYLEPARRIFKQYVLMEDAKLIHRISRSPDRRIFYINVGSIPPNEVENFMQKTISTMKRTPLMDAQTGEYNLKYNQQNLLEDFYISVSTVTYKQQTQIDLDKTAEGYLKIMETQGAQNIIVKTEDFDTQKGISGKKAYGTMTVLDKIKGRSAKMYYEVLLFSQNGGLQTIMVMHREDDKYGQQIAERMLNSVELQTAEQ